MKRAPVQILVVVADIQTRYHEDRGGAGFRANSVRPRVSRSLATENSFSFPLEALEYCIDWNKHSKGAGAEQGGFTPSPFYLRSITPPDRGSGGIRPVGSLAEKPNKPSSGRAKGKRV